MFRQRPAAGVGIFIVHHWDALRLSDTILLLRLCVRSGDSG
jgi:hypothetical protein